MLGIDIFLIYGLQIWKEGIKNKKDPENIKNMNKEDFLPQAQVHFSNYKTGVKPKSIPTTIKRSQAKEKRHTKS